LTENAGPENEGPAFSGPDIWYFILGPALSGPAFSATPRSSNSELVRFSGIVHTGVGELQFVYDVSVPRFLSRIAGACFPIFECFMACVLFFCR